MRKLPLRHVTPDAAAHVLHEFDEDGGFAPSRWRRDLIALIVRADRLNRGLLEIAYGDYVHAVRAMEYTETGLADLRAIAAGALLTETTGPAVLEVDR